MSSADWYRRIGADEYYCGRAEIEGAPPSAQRVRRVPRDPSGRTDGTALSRVLPPGTASQVTPEGVAVVWRPY